jgi:adenine-specific DNA-methyltransferase
MRSALVDHFRDEGQIMIATEAGAEGINLQFCSVVVNYDLPWNPQRIEQRIGRCHRYGQKHDVVVFNFINLKNAADKRVYELLEQKFHLFEGVFGASDEVLGAIESGVDFEKRIAAIYQACRSAQEITVAFDTLQQELSVQISEQVMRTQQQLLENFDEDVTLKVKTKSEQALSEYERNLMLLTRHELGAHAEFRDDGTFELKQSPDGKSPLGLYELPRRTGEAHTYRLAHPLAEYLIAQAKARVLTPAEITLNLSGRRNKISALEPHIGTSGLLHVRLLDIQSPSQQEAHLICAAITDSGVELDHELAPKLLTVAASDVAPLSVIPPDQETRVVQLADKRSSVIRQEAATRNQKFIEDEAAKLDGWADDQKLALEREIKELDRQIKEARRSAGVALSLEGKLAGQRLVKELETKRKNQRRALFDAEDEIDRKREELIAKIQDQLKQSDEMRPLFTIRWHLT